MKRLRKTVGAVLALACWLLTAHPAVAEQFYLRYDADDFPENEGWGRYWGDPDGEIVRFVEKGILHLDTRGSSAIFDLYELVSDAFNLDPDEELRLTWRMRTLETDAPYGLSDAAMAIVNESAAYAQFFLAPDYVSEDEIPGGEAEHLYPVDPAVPHTYYVISDDMLEYDLYVDGTFAFHGQFHDYAWREHPRITFGDTFTGYTSLSHWDYVEIAVVPEASSSVLGAALVTVAWGYRRIRQ